MTGFVWASFDPELGLYRHPTEAEAVDRAEKFLSSQGNEGDRSEIAVLQIVYRGTRNGELENLHQTTRQTYAGKV